MVATSLEYELNTSYQNYPGDYLSFQSLDIHEEITAYRETVSREVDFTKPVYVEQIRGLGSTFAHEMLDAVEELGCFAPSTLNELKTVGKSLLPNELKIPPELMNPSENFQQMISSGHKNIDRFFETNQAAGYTPEARKEHFSIAGLPPPVFQEALQGGRHAKLLQDYMGKTNRELRKGIVSYKKQIALHKDKIANPSKYYADWDQLHPVRQDTLINKKWPAEIKLYEEQRDILQAIINERTK